ncbi:YhcH/YjgK/YiaL family protein [Prevotella sp. HMSC073D09]|uniref:YhcH/YjgK/YiaL family protein n=1 Tax=Prevotella sp. HMSC073D09 TaxID=1739459 RepID=UPI0008A1ADED|nr:YhcH/YjgK/YiaL family protein [Prevotella sp. HMSC073D09]OFQ15434.1 YhcH/YjgK/YiaL family protein [Prevotella sp. HMSC073D09]
MVLDVLDNFGKYAALNPYFSLVDAFMRTHQLEELALGTYNIKGEDVVLKIEQAMGKSRNEAVLESHRQMIDIQIPLQQEETFGLAATVSLPPADYSAEKDISFYPNSPAQNYVTCPRGGFVIFFPQDAHAPCISEDANFTKAIFKVRCV